LGRKRKKKVQLLLQKQINELTGETKVCIDKENKRKSEARKTREARELLF
jgi:hypothetical protein